MILIGCRSILEFFWVKFQSAFGLGLVLRNFCIKEMMKFQRSCCQKKFQNSCFCFGYKLSFNHPNGVILIGKEP